MIKRASKYLSFQNTSVISRMIIALIFTSSIFCSEFLKVNQFQEDFTIELIDFSEKGEAEKEGQKESKNEQTEVDDFCHHFSLIGLCYCSHISHDYYYSIQPSNSYLDIPEQPPKL